MAIQCTGLQVRVKFIKFGDSRPNRSRNIRLPQMRDERRDRHTPVITYGKTPYGVLPKKFGDDRDGVSALFLCCRSTKR